ncbi:hypothetical protein, partial [Burkholderia sp. SIMBA_052]|uniref:hypothetical protein n=1 Tax=Burkholderia sp. SIMBA_052 TaxID=3085793 RepID=UPI0039787731
EFVPDAEAFWPTAVEFAAAVAPVPRAVLPSVVWVLIDVSGATAVESDARLSLVVDSPVDSEVTLLSVVLNPVDNEVILLFVELRPVDVD